MRLRASNLYWLRAEKIARLKPLFQKYHGRSRVDDLRVLTGIIFVNRNKLRWRDASQIWSAQDVLRSQEALGGRPVFVGMMIGLAARWSVYQTTVIDATYLKTHRAASSLRIRKRMWAA